MAIILIAVWLLIYGILALVSVDLPRWITPALAVVVGLVVLGVSRRKAP